MSIKQAKGTGKGRGWEWGKSKRRGSGDTGEELRKKGFSRRSRQEEQARDVEMGSREGIREWRGDQGVERGLGIGEGIREWRGEWEGERRVGRGKGMGEWEWVGGVSRESTQARE